MAEASSAGAPACAFCGTPIIQFDKVVEVDDRLYCCPNCELAARVPGAARAARRGGGLVLTCNHCFTPIFVPEIMVTRGQASYCCLNCAEVAERRQAATAAPQPSRSA